MNEDIVTTKTDDVFFQNGERYSITDYLHGVNDVLDKIKDTGDFELGVNVIRSMTGAAHAVGVSLAKLLHGMWQLWDKSEQEFYEYLNEFTPIQPLTVSRYIEAWNAFLSVPEILQPSYISMPVKNLSALGAAISQGFIPEDDEWEKLADTTSNNEFLKVLREDVKGCEPRKNSLVIYLEPDGSLVAWMDNKRCAVGYLNVDDIEEDDVLYKAITRITKSAGILRR